MTADIRDNRAPDEVTAPVGEAGAGLGQGLEVGRKRRTRLPAGWDPRNPIPYPTG